MKKIGALGLTLLVGCTANFGEEKKESPKEAKDSSTLTVGMNLAGGEHTETSWVDRIELICPDASKEMDFTQNEQSAIIFHNLEDCDILLKKFSVEKDGHTHTFEITNRLSQGFHVYDAEVNGVVVDTKLAMSMINIEDNCDYVGNCDFDNVSVRFIYSKLVGEEVVLDNNLAISALDLEIDAELPPWCTLEAQFEQVAWHAPELVLNFTDCQMLFPSNELELTVFENAEGTEFTIENLHNLIDAETIEKNGSSSFEIRLTLEELAELAGTDNVLEALTTDLVVAMRNKGGKSIKYYVIDNNCEPLNIIGYQEECVEWDLLDHPDGSAQPPLYGLRLDSMNGWGTTTFSFESNGSSVKMTRNPFTNELNIAGTIYGGENQGSGYSSNVDSWTLNMTYNTNVTKLTNGYKVQPEATGEDNSGEIVADTLGVSQRIYDRATGTNPSFEFKADGHRISGDNSTWVGRGWLGFTDARNGASGNQDFLFRAECTKYKNVPITE